MDWQQIASLIVVSIASFLIIRSEWRKRQRVRLGACGHDCGCSTKALNAVKKEVITSNP